MPTYEEHMQKVLDLRAWVLDPERDNPSAEEVYEAVQALHATRGVAAAKKKSTTVIPVDLNALFADSPKKEDGNGS